jgi:hypothetical protein
MRDYICEYCGLSIQKLLEPKTERARGYVLDYKNLETGLDNWCYLATKVLLKKNLYHLFYIRKELQSLNAVYRITKVGLKQVKQEKIDRLVNEYFVYKTYKDKVQNEQPKIKPLGVKIC